VAKITIDLDRKIGKVDPRIYSAFAEQLGRCVYGGIYEEGSPLSDEHGYRKDVLEKVRSLKPPLLRWPGGNFVSGYHWTDGVGPVEQRPRRMELAWHTEESNRFGTGEFIQYCRLIEAEPYLCANMGTGTLDEAQAWVEYCNGTGNTYWANLRRKNGHEEPYGVKYWGLGNELYGKWQIGALNAEDYTKRAIEFAKIMKWTDPTIQLVSCGKNGWDDWDRVVLERLARYIDFHSIHIYTGSSDYYSNVLAPHQAERAIEICQGLIERVRYSQRIEHPISIAYDEWNVWFRTQNDTHPGLEEIYTLADALAVATYLNGFIRHCRSVGIANYAQLVNVIAPIFTSKQGMFLQTIYYPLYLYREYMREVALDVYVDSGLLPFDATTETSTWPHRVADRGPFQSLDVTATCDAAGRDLVLACVNRNKEQPMATTVQLVNTSIQAYIRTHEVNAPDVNAVNSFEQTGAGEVQEDMLDSGGQSFTYTFPAHSLTILRLRIA
jgi:alpha-L-arabinofuranosidase